MSIEILSLLNTRDRVTERIGQLKALYLAHLSHGLEVRPKALPLRTVSRPNFL
jgi:hypothetical protein